MSTLTASFDNRQTPFFTALKIKVEGYFKHQNLSKKGNFSLYLKTAIILGTTASVYLTLLLITLPWWLFSLFAIVLGVCLSAIGFNIMHDGAHGSYSQNPLVNNLMAHTLDLMGGSSFYWKSKHNVIHHTYTNLDGLDDDIDIKPWIRTNEGQEKKKYHQFQYLYGFFLYAITHSFWVWWQDFLKYFTQKIGSTEVKRAGFWGQVEFWLTKLNFLILTLGLPFYFLGMGKMFLLYGLVSCTTGFTLAVTFQLAHVVQTTDFPVILATHHQVEEEWAIHQIKTTANFATRNPLVTWLTGGLNHQIEHHLFPKISHVHYPALQKLVQETCREFNLTYNEFPTLGSALLSHGKQLYLMGKP